VAVLLLASVLAIPLGTFETGAAAGEAMPIWPMLDGDARHTGVSAFNASVVTPDVLWQMNPTGSALGLGIAQSSNAFPVIGADGTVYVADCNGNVSAVSRDGMLIWSDSMGDRPYGTPAIAADGTLYVALDDARTEPGGTAAVVCALDPNGTARWRSFVPGHMPDLTLAPDGTIYLTTFIGNDSFPLPSTLGTSLAAIDPNGTVQWTFLLPPDSRGPVSVRPDGIVLVVGGQNLTAVRANGSLAWRLPLERAYDCSRVTVTEDGTALFVRNGTLFSVAANGSVLWTRDMGLDYWSSPVIYDHGDIFLLPTNLSPYAGEVRALKANGAINWTYPLQNRLTAAGGVMSANGLLIFLDGRSLSAITRSGTLAWTTVFVFGSMTSGGLETPVIGPDGRIYVLVSGVNGSRLLVALGHEIGGPISILLVAFVMVIAVMVLAVVTMYVEKRRREM
jgi:outer membrane protein assembly factor BamB